MAKPVKIKRNTSVSGRKRQRKVAARKVAGLVAAGGVLLAIGFFLVPAVVGLVNNRPEKQPEQQPPVESVVQPVQTQQPQQSAEPTVNPGDAQQPQSAKQVYSFVEYSHIATPQLTQQTADSFAAKGVTRAVITLKDSNGLVCYDTHTAIGSAAKANSLVDVAQVKEIFEQRGIVLVANIYTFKDHTAPTVDGTVAVKYIGTDMQTNWLDNAPGIGKRWANPASSTMQQYIADLVKEINTEFGIEDFIFSGVQLPEGYSLDKRDFGVSDSALQAQLQGFINTMEAMVNACGGTAHFAFDITAATGGNTDKYMVAPQRLGAENLMLYGGTESYSSIDPVSLAANLEENYSVESVIFCNTEGNFTDNYTGDSSYFVR